MKLTKSFLLASILALTTFAGAAFSYSTETTPSLAGSEKPATVVAAVTTASYTATVTTDTTTDATDTSSDVTGITSAATYTTTDVTDITTVATITNHGAGLASTPSQSA